MKTYQPQFKGHSGRYFLLWLWTWFVTLITLTLALPWADIKRRRYLAAQTEINGKPCVYRGELATLAMLYIGYLITLLVIQGVIFWLQQQRAEELALLLSFAIPVVIYKFYVTYQGFHLEATGWEGFQGAFGGSALGVFLWYSLLPAIVLSAGIFFGWELYDQIGFLLYEPSGVIFP